MKRLLARCAAALVAGGCCGFLAAGAAADRLSPDPPVRRIVLTAAKYEFSTKEIRVRKGEPVTLALTTPDFVHGFSMPDFNVRTDAIPGKIVEITFTPHKAGRFVFLCDNFCGEGHDRMSGFLVVAD